MPEEGSLYHSRKLHMLALCVCMCVCVCAQQRVHIHVCANVHVSTYAWVWRPEGQLLSSHVTLPPGAGLSGAFHCSPYHMWALRILFWVLTLVHKRYSTQAVSSAHCGSLFHCCCPYWLPVRRPGHMLPCFQQSLKYLLPFYRLP